MLTDVAWMQAIVDGLGGVLFKFPFRVPAYYALILRSLTVLEGLALQADKNYKLLGKAYPYMAKRLLIDPAPELRSAFSHLQGCSACSPAPYHFLTSRLTVQQEAQAARKGLMVPCETRLLRWS